MEHTIMIGIPLSEYKEMMREVVREVVQEETKPLRRQFEDRLITRDEAAKKLNVTLHTLWNLEKRGELIPNRIGKKVLYRETVLTQYLNRKSL